MQHGTAAIVSGCRKMEKWTGEKETARQEMTKMMKGSAGRDEQWQDRQCFDPVLLLAR